MYATNNSQKIKKIVKLILPQDLINSIVIVRNKQKIKLTYFLLKLAVKSEFLSSLYYGLFSKAFAKEHFGCIYGQLKYLEESQTPKESQYCLRRNIHRLEKGLLMRPRRNIFAVDYITETFHSYEKVLEASDMSSNLNELTWAYDVLLEYFTVVGSHPIIDEVRNKFFDLKPINKAEVSRIPYKRDISRPCSVSYENLLELSHRRRSVRWYLQKPVPRELIDKAVAIAALSPSACNRQPFEFRIFDEPEIVKKVASIPMGTQGFSHNFPVVVVVVGKLRAYFSERDRHVIYIDGSLASMSFMYALETLGLSSCPINWPDIAQKEREMAQLLKLEPDERPIMLISLGYPDPDGMVAYSQKKSLNQICSYN